jgi:hypothetical protein
VSLPVNRIGAIRGPDGATLSDVVALLSQMRDQQQVTNQELINISLQINTLDTRLGAINDALIPLVTIANATTNTYEETQALNTLMQAYINLAGATETFQGAAFLMENNRDWNRYTGQIANQRLGGLENRASELLDAIGRLIHPPTGSNLKDLLRSLDTNILNLLECCRGDTGGEGPPTNPIPDTICSSATLGTVRMTGWTNANSPVDFGGTADNYVMEFSTINSVTSDLIRRDVDSGGQGIPFPAMYPTDSVTLCLSWNLIDDNPPEGLYIMRAGVDDWYSNNVINATTVNPITTPTGSFQFNVNTDQRFFIMIDKASGVTLPGLNFFLAVDIAA